VEHGLDVGECSAVKVALCDHRWRVDQSGAECGLQLPDAIADPEAHSILTDIIKASGLRKLTLHLRDAAAFASKRSEPLTWDHFTAAFRAITTLSK
jgi:hypothetical protein